MFVINPEEIRQSRVQGNFITPVIIWQRRERYRGREKGEKGGGDGKVKSKSFLEKKKINCRKN